MSDNEYNSALVDSATECNAAFYREGGIWKIKLFLPEWLIRDIAADCSNHNNPTIFANIDRVQAGYSYFGTTTTTLERLIGICNFELVNMKDKDGE